MSTDTSKLSGTSKTQWEDTVVCVCVCSYSERGAVPAEDSSMQSGDPVSGPEVQVSSSAAQDFNQLAALLQLDSQSQRTLWDTSKQNKHVIIVVPK